MNLILLEPDELAGDQSHTVRLEGRRAEHIRRVLRSEVGDTVSVGVVNGPLGSARIIGLDTNSVTVQVELGNCPPRPRTTVILAMVRPQIMKRTLQHLATLGVRRIVLIGSRRTEPAYFGQRLFDGDAYQEPLRLGLEQARDTMLPEVTIYRRFRPFIEDTLPSLLANVDRRFVAHPVLKKAQRGLERIPPSYQVALAIGPEGGWLDYEVERFVELGFEPVTLGPRILKVETAVPYLFGALGL